jgi:hypothetical protein
VSAYEARERAFSSNKQRVVRTTSCEVLRMLSSAGALLSAEAAAFSSAASCSAVA